MWIPEDERRNAEIEGCTVVDPASVLVTHLAGRSKEQFIFDSLKEKELKDCWI